MKRILTMLALAVSAFFALTLSSCGDDNDIEVKKAETIYSVDYQYDGMAIGVRDAVMELLKTKLNGVANVTGLSNVIVTTTNEKKTEAILKGITEEEMSAAFDKLEGLKSITLTVTKNYSKICVLSHTCASKAAGLYTYVESVGGESYTWKLLLTNEDGKNGNMLGIIVLPREINGIPKGAYEGEYYYYTPQNVVFRTYYKTPKTNNPYAHVTMMFNEDLSENASIVIVDTERVLAGVSFAKE